MGRGRRGVLPPGHERAVRNLRSASVVSADHRDVLARRFDSHRLQHDGANAAWSCVRAWSARWSYFLCWDLWAWESTIGHMVPDWLPDLYSAKYLRTASR